MKKIILSIAILSSLVSCNNKEKHNASIERARQAAIDSVEYANKQQRKIDSLEALTRVTTSTLTGIEERAMVPLAEDHKKVAPRKNIPSVKHPAETTPSTAGNTPASTNEPAVSNATVAPTNEPSVATTPEKKKGLNNSAKGAIIGLGTGAAAGAIIGKDNRGKGAIIGGVAGAIGGAVGGAVLDHRKNKKAAEAAKRDSIRQDSIRRSK